MVNLDKIKELVKEAIKTNDDELISLATDLLKKKQEETKPIQQQQQSNDEFLSPIKTLKKQEVNMNRSPVNMGKRFNSFVDDRTEAVGEEYQTPQVKLTERKRKPAERIDQTCVRCNRTYKVAPVHKRDYFICDKCLTSAAR